MVAAPAGGTSRRSACRPRAGARRRRRPARPCTAATRDCSVVEEPRARDGLEVAELVRDVGDAVGLEHQPRPELPLGARRLRPRSGPRSRTRSTSARGRLLERRRGDPLHRRQRQRVEKRLALSAAARRDTTDASPRSTSAVYSRARRCGGTPRKLDQRFTPFAPVSAASSTSIGKKSASSPPARATRTSDTPSSLALDDDAALADLRRLDDRTRGGRGAGGIAPKCFSARRSTSSVVTSPTTTSVALSGT